MRYRWEEGTLALTPDTEQERALLELVAGQSRGWKPTPPTDEDIMRRGAASPPPPGS